MFHSQLSTMKWCPSMWLPLVAMHFRVIAASKQMFTSTSMISSQAHPLSTYYSKASTTDDANHPCSQHFFRLTQNTSSLQQALLRSKSWHFPYSYQAHLRSTSIESQSEPVVLLKINCRLQHYARVCCSGEDRLIKSVWSNMTEVDRWTDTVPRDWYVGRTDSGWSFVKFVCARSWSSID